jgi:hypothetical protein
MRLWSLHPKYLDAKGLVALWREALLAKHVLEGKTKGYTNHPQLSRFKKTKNPVETINQYLSEIYLEAFKRNYNFEKGKIDWNFQKSNLTVTRGQLNYEARHLLNKLKTRNITRFEELKSNSAFENHPLFIVVEGDIEEWEILKDTLK